jgi:hypothetical protein
VPTVDEVSAARRFEPKSLDISWRSTWASQSVTCLVNRGVIMRGELCGFLRGRLASTDRRPGSPELSDTRILVIAWHLLSTGETYADRGADYFDRRRSSDTRQRRLLAQLEAMGFAVRRR